MGASGPLVFQLAAAALTGYRQRRKVERPSSGWATTAGCSPASNGTPDSSSPSLNSGVDLLMSYELACDVFKYHPMWEYPDFHRRVAN